MLARNRTASILTLGATLAACGQGDVTGPGEPGPGSNPPPAAVVTYDVVVTLKALQALGDCDRNERVLGASVGGPGEFAYNLWVSSDGGIVRRVETPAYGQRGTGTASRLIDNGARHTLNETVRLTRRTGQSFTLGFAAIEWDGVVLTVRDPDLNGQVKQRPITLEEIGTGMSLDLQVGDGDNCGLRLTYDVTSAAR